MNINDLRSRISELTGNKEFNRYLSRLGSASGPMELASVIWFSKADIRDKAELLSGLISSEYFESYPDSPYEPNMKKRILDLNADLTRAVSYLKHDDAYVYLLKEISGSGNGSGGNIVGAVPFRSVQGALDHIRNWAAYEANSGFYVTEEQMTEFKKRTWFRLEVFNDRNNDPETRGLIAYFITADRVILGYKNMLGISGNGNGRMRVFPPTRMSLPFERGDILYTDPSPFAPPVYSVLIETGYPQDKDFPFCICCADGRLQCTSLRNSHAWPGFHSGMAVFAPEMVTETFNGRLPEDMKLLGEISAYVKSDKNNGRELFEFLIRNTEDAPGGNTLTEEMVRMYLQSHR